jgi:GTPase Era involved in 16S rRNA processing
MKAKRVRQKNVKIGVGSSRIKDVIKELRKQYEPMLKRLAE